MKFIANANSKKVRIAAETAAEEAWVSTLKKSSKRITRGAERFVLKACAEWISANGGAAAVAKKAVIDRARKRIRRENRLNKEVFDWACRLYYNPDYRKGLTGKSSSVKLVCLANRLAQIVEVPGPDLLGVPWNRRAGVILCWVDGYTL